MKNILFLLFTFFASHIVFCQVKSDYQKPIDTSYREDQFYLGITYNLLTDMPSSVSQNGFSSGVHFGVIRDMPINKNRNKAIGIGLGLSLNSFNQNILISEDNNQFDFSLIDSELTDFSKNKFYTYVIELPIEYRWRTSTATQYKFWRLYTGFKMGYLFANGTKFNGEPKDVVLRNSDAFSDFQYGLTVSAGYNTWNFYMYYGLNTIFKDASMSSEALDMKAIKIGLMFYIL